MSKKIWEKIGTEFSGSWSLDARDFEKMESGINGRAIDFAKLGWLFLNDPDARPIGTAHPKAHLWDNGEDAAEELLHALEVRRVALERFDASRVRTGRPRSELEEVLVPVYFHHRFQLEAAVALVGGLDYVHGVRGDATPAPRPVPPADQRRALDAVLTVLDPGVLDIPETAIRAVPPRAPGSAPHRETFVGRAAPEGARMGHAGAIIEGEEGTAARKIKALADAGVRIAYRPSEIPERIRELGV